MLSQAAFAGVAHPSAQAFNLQSWNQTSDALRMRYDVNRAAMIKANKTQLDSKYKSTNVGQAGRLMIFMMALTGVELVRTQAREAKLSGKVLSNDEYAKMARDAALKVVDSGDVWFGIFSDLGIGAVSKKPAEVLSVVIKDKVARPLLVNLIQNGIMSIIYFVGWQACSQLWRDARLLLDEKDYEKSERIWSLGAKGLLDMARSNDNSDEARITRLMIANIVKILIFDNELRENWFYNTWRLAVATGRFVTLVTGIITATTIGSTIFPGAGTILGFMFAFTGAIAAATLPKSVNNSISQKLKDARINTRKFQASTWNWRLKNLIASYGNHNLYWYWQRSGKSITQSFETLAKIREHIATAYLEKVFLANTNAQQLNHDLEIALQTKRPASVTSQIQRQLDHENTIKLNSLVLLARFYEAEFHKLEALKVPNQAPSLVSEQLENAKSDIAAVYSFWVAFTKSTQKPDLIPTTEVLLQNFYLRSFKEAAIVKVAKQRLVNRAS